MATVTIKIPDNALEEAQEIADEHHDGNRSAAIRELVDKGLRYGEVETERDRLQRQLRATHARQNDVTELVEFVEEQREAERYRDRRRRRLDEAHILKRWKWKLTGIPVEGSDE